MCGSMGRLIPHMTERSKVVFLIACLFVTGLLVIQFFPGALPTKPAVQPTHTQTILGAVARTDGCVSVDGLPDHACTPGSIDPQVTQDNIRQTICVSGYTATVRPPTSYTNKIKKERMAAYGHAGSMSDYELDHLIPLAIGGSPRDVANLWPEPEAGSQGALSKDKVENYLHRAVCAGEISLSEAQTEIAGDWRLIPIH